MPAYLIAETKTMTDQKLFDDYAKVAGPTVRAFGGKVLAGGASRALEGDWQPDRLIIIEFESADKLKAWYNSPEYQEVLPMRLKASDSNLIILGE